MPDKTKRLSAQAGYLLLFSSYAILTPYLPLYLKARGFSPSRIGLLLGSLELAGIAGPILVASLADRRTAYRAFLAAALLLPALLLVPSSSQPPSRSPFSASRASASRTAPRSLCSIPSWGGSCRTPRVSTADYALRGASGSSPPRSSFRSRG